MTPLVFVIIATALNRTSILIERSLSSVYKQSNIDAKKVKVVVVDDNEIGKDGLPLNFETNCLMINELRGNLNIHSSDFETFVMPNSRTKGSSGTGAWNTGIHSSFEQDPRGYVAILDDDDEFLPQHLYDCLQAVSNDVKILAVFQELKWINQDGSILDFPLTYDVINEIAFFIGNPGIQGSNMFFKTSSLMEIDGFDETLGGSTDRDLMIRFLKRNYKDGAEIKSIIRIINSIGVIHHNHHGERITQASLRKHKALDMFYKKHSSYYNEDAYRSSLERALKLFNYSPNCEY